MRTEAEIRDQLEKFRQQALEYRHERQRPEAAFCAVIVSALAYVLGDTSSPTVRVKLDRE